MVHVSRRSLLTGVAALALLVASVAVVPARSARAATKAPVKVTASQLLVTAKGLALYVFAPDKPNVSTCYATCAKYWPPLLVSASAKVPPTMPGIPGKFGTTMRKDGTQQLTYDGAPLYTFIKDKDAGDMYGQGLVASGGYWWAVVVARGTSSGSSG